MTHATRHPARPLATDTATTQFEVVVVGVGFAGLAAAQVLGRAQRKVLLIGAGPTRNAEAAHSHNLLTRDGAPPGQLLGAGMAEVQALPTVTIRTDQVAAVSQTSDGSFGLSVHDETIRAAQVLIATGARDRLPDVPGLPALWGRRAHSCPFCDGAAYAGQRLMILASSPVAEHLKALLSGWTSDLILASPADVRRISEQGADIVATLADGESVTIHGVFVHTEPLPRVDLIADLELARRGLYVATDAIGQTSLAGLWAAGDCAWRDGEPMPGGQVVAAMAAGARSAASIVLELQGIHVPPTPEADPPSTAERTSPAPWKGGHQLPDGMGLTEFWEGHYATADRVWTGEPNEGLVRAVSDLDPSTALELGCGEGGDAVWLAGKGWEVTGIDVSATAVARAIAAAAERDLQSRTTFRVADLGAEPPSGRYGLVVAAYLLSPVEIPRDAILQAAAKAVDVGGTLVVLSHVGFPGGGGPGGGGPGGGGHSHMSLLSVAEQLDALDLGEEWEVTMAEEFTRTRRNHDGTVMQHVDSVITAIRG